MKDHRENITKIVQKALVWLVICIFLEGVCFNISSISTNGLEEVFLDPSKAVYEDCHLTFDNVDITTETLEVTFDSFESPMNVSVSVRDDSNREWLNEADKCMVTPRCPVALLRVNSKGTLYGFEVNWTEKDAVPVSVILNKPIPYNFRFIRFLLLFLPGLLFVIIISGGFWKTEWDPANQNHKLVYSICCLLCVITALLFFRIYDSESLVVDSVYTKQTVYPFEEDIMDIRDMQAAVTFDTLKNQGGGSECHPSGGTIPS